MVRRLEGERRLDTDRGLGPVLVVREVRVRARQRLGQRIALHRDAAAKAEARRDLIGDAGGDFFLWEDLVRRPAGQVQRQAPLAGRLPGQRQFVLLDRRERQQRALGSALAEAKAEVQRRRRRFRRLGQGLLG